MNTTYVFTELISKFDVSMKHVLLILLLGLLL